MPLYEYYCPQCGKFETMKAIEHSERAKCTHCNSESKRVPSTFNFKFSNPFPVRGNIAGDGEGFTTKYLRNEEIAELK